MTAGDGSAIPIKGPIVKIEELGKKYLGNLKFTYWTAPCTNVPITLPAWTYTVSGTSDYHATNTYDFTTFGTSGAVSSNKTEPRFDYDMKTATYAWPACNIKYTCKPADKGKSCNTDSFSSPNSTIKFSKKYATIEAGESRGIDAEVAEFSSTA